MIIKENYLYNISLVLIFALFFVSGLYFSKADTFSVPEEQHYENASKQINVNMYKKADSFRIDNLEVVVVDFHYSQNYNEWKDKSFNGCVLSFKNKPLGYFGAPGNLSITNCEDYIDDNGNPIGDCTEQTEGELTVQLPYFPNGKYADIYDPAGKKVLTIDLSSKATCNENDKCDQPIEDSENCPQDCKKNEPVINIQSTNLTPVSADQSVADGSTEKKIGFSPIIIIAIILVLGLSGGIGYYVYRRNKDGK